MQHRCKSGGEVGARLTYKDDCNLGSHDEEKRLKAE